jgi:hypothetical protein
MVCLNGCTNLTSVPEQLFPSVTNKQVNDSTCKNMFKNCENLTTLSPKFLTGSKPITHILPYGYYGMFEGCTKLENIPYESLNALMYGKESYTLANMFKNCIALEDISKLKLNIRYANYWYPSYAYSNMFERMYCII